MAVIIKGYDGCHFIHALKQILVYIPIFVLDPLFIR